MSLLQHHPFVLLAMDMVIFVYYMNDFLQSKSRKAETLYMLNAWFYATRILYYYFTFGKKNGARSTSTLGKGKAAGNGMRPFLGMVSGPCELVSLLCHIECFDDH